MKGKRLQKGDGTCSSSNPTRGGDGSFLARSGCCSEREIQLLRFCANLEMRDRPSLHWGRGQRQDRSSMAGTEKPPAVACRGSLLRQTNSD